MECHSGMHVRLRSRLHGTYLHADENGVSVSLSPDRASLNTVWRVEAVHLRHLRGKYFSLQGAAYGRYLAVLPENAQRGHGPLLRQNIFYGQQNVDALWQPSRVGGAAWNEVVIRHCRYSAWHIGVTVQNPDDLSTRWIIEMVPWRSQPPVLPRPVLDPGVRFPFPATRTILYARSGNHGEMVPTSSWGKMDFAGRSVLNLRAKLALVLGEANPSDITLYAWTGYNIPRIALVVDLPSNMDPIVIGVLSTRSPAALTLRHPDVDAQ